MGHILKTEGAGSRSEYHIIPGCTASLPEAPTLILSSFSVGIPQLMLPEAPQHSGLLYYPPYWTSQLSPPRPRYHAP
jgi:hypothetical protein